MQFGYNHQEIYSLFQEYSKKIKYVDLKNVLKAIYGLAIKRKLTIKGLNDGRIIEEAVNEACIKKNIKNLKQIKMPLLMPSIELHTGDVYCFCSKSVRREITNKIMYINDINIGKAVRASCSYPVIFSPCRYDGLELTDGGLRENVPWKETKAIGADKVISVIFDKEIEEKKTENIIDVVEDSLSILKHELSSYELEGSDCLLKIKTEEISLLDMRKN